MFVFVTLDALVVDDVVFGEGITDEADDFGGWDTATLSLRIYELESEDSENDSK